MQSSPGTIGYAKEKTTGSENGKPKEKEKEKENEKEKEKDIYMGASPRAKGAYIYISMPAFWGDRMLQNSPAVSFTAGP